MSDDTKALYLLVALLLLTACLLLYSDWRLQGEIDHLHARVDGIDVRPVARVLRARDDETAEAVAKEGNV